MKRVTGPVLAVALAAVGGAQAQVSMGDGPMDITGNYSEYIGARCMNLWRGEVEAIQAQQRLRAPEIRAFFRPRAAGEGTNRCSGEVERIEADGPVYFVTPTQSARGNSAVYTTGNDILVLTGDVIVTEGQNVVTGQRLVINTRTNDSQMFAGTQGRNSPGRVRGVLFPDQAPGSGGGARR